MLNFIVIKTLKRFSILSRVSHYPNKFAAGFFFFFALTFAYSELALAS